ncbi:MAG: [Fe-Fe] hydrogenase large subunit C-terminal domain-containing protein [Candidatus ainarchaeum sp.]|nr:[Fe-Fe] hydrogenase large subunit C-terminal domain-containing protein [Candidatus ainarchaeum sp.]
MRPDLFKQVLSDKNKIIIAQIAPAVQVSIGELFGYEPGTPLYKKLIFALKKLGVKYVFDTSFGADICVVEESKEFESRIKQGEFPIINSCCPGTVSFLEHAYPDLVGNMATVKSPMEVTGALIKSYFAEKMNILPDNIFSIAIMPCVIKKAEALRPELRVKGKLMVDGVITTKEISEILKENNIELSKCEDMDFDSLMGTASGAGKIFGSSGGVGEAALRNYAYINNLPLEKIDKKNLRGEEGIREITYSSGKIEFKMLVINSLRNASILLNDKEKLKKYHFVEIMACLGGCVGGAGQPQSTKENLEKRRKGLYQIDEGLKLKVPSQNPEIQKLYENYLGSPMSRKAKQLLHTGFEETCVDCYQN